LKTKLHLGRGAAILACAASLASTAVVVAPTAASARSASTCANKSVELVIEGNPPIHIPVRAITLRGGIGCAEAYKVITATLGGNLPKGWKSAIAHFEAPEGLVPQELKKGSKKIRYAVQGG
jgi:hypothetical protein